MSQYKRFPKAELVREWDKLLKLSREEIVNLLEEWKRIDEENREIYKRNIEERKERIDKIVNVLEEQGIDPRKYKKKGFFKEKNGYQAWFKNNVVEPIVKKYPNYYGSIPTPGMDKVEVDGCVLWNNKSPIDIVELYDKIKHQYEEHQRKVRKNNILLVRSIEFASKHNIDIEGLEPNDIIALVHEEAVKQYKEEQLPVGTEIYLKHLCDNCSSYFVGERRCSCGNRRIQIIVEGNIIDGFYHYPEAF